MKAVDAIMRGEVSCSREDAPDDMTIGVWLKALGIPIVHSPLFHQVCSSNVILSFNFVPHSFFHSSGFTQHDLEFAFVEINDHLQ